MENIIPLFFYTCYLFYTLFFPAAEAVKPVESTKQRRNLLLPSPMLSPSFSSDEESVYSTQDFQLDELFDWEGQQVGN